MRLATLACSGFSRLRHELGQTFQELLHQNLIKDDIVQVGFRTGKSVQQTDVVTLVVGGGRIKRKDVTGCMEFTVVAHAVAEPPLISGAHAAVMILLTLPEIGAPCIELLVLFG